MKIKDSEWIEYHERIKFQLILNLLYFFSISMFVIGSVSVFSDHLESVSNFSVSVFCFIGILILKKTKKYKLVGGLCCFLAFGFIASMFIFTPGMNFLTLLWMIVNVFLIFFILGSVWGVVALIAHFSLLFYFLMTFRVGDFMPISRFNSLDFWSFSLEFMLAAFALGYILVLYSKTVEKSQKGLRTFNLELKNQNEIVLKQNSEMEVMLREIHHRVKNNLQIVSSLLRLEAAKAIRKNDVFYQSTIDRVSAMAMVHEKMYQSGSLSQFDLEKYLETLIASLLRSYSFERRPEVQIHVDIEKMQSKSIIPFALLINELILNSLKHAFTRQDDPIISIEVTQLPNHSDPNRFGFVYFDNGFWAENSISSFGTEIIEAMVEQLDGDFSLEISPDGTTYRFELANLR